MSDPYEFHERIAIIMDSCGVSEAEAIQMTQRQRREAESQRLVQERLEAAR